MSLSQLDLKKLAKRKLARRAQARRSIQRYTKETFKQYKNENWHHELIFEYYQRAIAREITHLMVFAPPRHMKTEGLERAICWALGKNHDEKIMGCAYGSTKAKKTSLKIKNNLSEDAHNKIFKDFPGITGVSNQDFWELGQGTRGSYLAKGVGGGITGEGFTIGIIDDPVKSREEAESVTFQEKTFEWYEGTFLNRKDSVDSVIILTNTRWSKKDLSGKILERDGIATYNGHEPDERTPEWNGQENGLWHILCLPAIMEEDFLHLKHANDPRKVGDALWPSRFPVSFLEQFKKNKHDWNSLYQQRPQPKTGNLLSRAWFGIVDRAPQKGEFVRFWDLASTTKTKSNDPDFTAGALCCLSDGLLYIVDIVTTRSTPKDRYKLIENTAEQDKQRFGNVKQLWEEEGGSSGKDVSFFMKNLLSKYKRSPYRVGKAKEFYIELLANKAETGDVFCVKGKWLGDLCDSNTFFDELELFPKGSHDDRIDAVAKACHSLVESRGTVNSKDFLSLMR